MKTPAFRCIAIILSIVVLLVFPGFSVYATATAPGSSIPFSSLTKEQQDIFLKAVERLLDDVLNRTDSPVISYTMPDGTTYTGTKSEIMEQVKEKANADFVSGILEADGTTLNYIMTNTDTSAPSIFMEGICGKAVLKAGSLIISSSDYQNTVNDTINKLYGEKTPWEIGIEIANGKPQNVTNIKQDSYISVFDTLGLQYTVAPSLLDFEFDVVTKNSYVSNSLYYTPYFITSDNKLYLFQADITTGYRSDYNLLFYTFYNLNYSSTQVEISYNFHQIGRFSFRFVDNSGHLYFCLLSSCYFSKSNMLYYTQYTNGRPGVPNAPLLFYDYQKGFGAPSSVELNFAFNNYTMPDNIDISFVNSVDKTDVLYDSDILSADIIAAGYFQGNRSSIRFDSSTLNVAGQMLLSGENVVSGGDKTITSDLTDLQKAIYVLAQQQGISFEEMLKKLDLIIDSNGEITLLGFDGIEYSVTELSKKFDEVIGAVGDISGDLSELLAYLKSLNMEGLDKYIQSIEGTLNDLNERDKDNSALLGDCLGSLRDLKDVMEGLSADVSSIADTITKIESVELDIADNLHKLDPPSSITTKFPFSLPFDVYNIFNVLSADPVTPKFTIPFDFSSIGGEVYEINIDLSQFDYIANIVRWFLYGVFLIGLAVLTNKLIGRG